MLIGGHGRCNNPDYNAKYLHYTIVDQKASKIVGLLLTQKKSKRSFEFQWHGKNSIYQSFARSNKRKLRHNAIYFFPFVTKFDLTAFKKNSCAAMSK